MDKVDIQNYMDKAGDNNVYIFTDEDIMYNTKGEHSIVIFDYTNEVVHVIRTNVDVRTQSDDRPFELTTFEFARIVFMRMVITEEDALASLESYKTLMTTAEYDRAVDILRGSTFAINSNYGTPTGGNYIKPLPDPIINANNGSTIYDPTA